MRLWCWDTGRSGLNLGVQHYDHFTQRRVASDVSSAMVLYNVRFFSMVETVWFLRKNPEAKLDREVQMGFV